MKRFIITALAATLVLGTTMAADAVRQHRLAEDAMAIEQAWTAWLLGGSSNALLAEDFCGEIVDGKFFLTVTIVTGASRTGLHDPERDAGRRVAVRGFLVGTDRREDRDEAVQ